MKILKFFEKFDFFLKILKILIFFENFEIFDFSKVQYSTVQYSTVCSHMVETDNVFSHWKHRNFAIHGRNVHQKASDKKSLTWSVYLLECLPCLAQYIGSTNNIPNRWGNHKSNANLCNSTSSGMAKHYSDGCPHDNKDTDKPQLRITIVDYLDTTPALLQAAGHVPGVKCRCSECGKLKNIEDKWILRLGTFNGRGLNNRDEVKSKCRGMF